MGYEFFSYDPEEGINYHDSADDARGEAEATLDLVQDAAADSAFGWEGTNVNDVCWGIVCGRAERTSSRPANEDEQKRGIETIDSYAVRDNESEPLAQIDDIASQLDDAQADLADARAPNVAKGKEAEELRSAIEELIAGKWGDGSEDDIEEMEDWAKRKLQSILDEVDARDSLDYVEAQAKKV